MFSLLLTKLKRNLSYCSNLSWFARNVINWIELIMTPNSDKYWVCHQLNIHLRTTNEMWCIHIYITSKLLCLLNIYTCQVLSQFSAKKSWVFKIQHVHILEIILWFIKTKCLAWWTVKMLQKQQPQSS